MLTDLFVDHPLLIDVLWQSTAWLLAGLALAHLLRKTPAASHAILLGCMLAAIATPSLSALSRDLGWGLFEPLGVTSDGVDAPPPPLPDIGARNGGIEITLAFVLAGAWVVTSAALLFRLAASFVLGTRLVRRTGPIESGRIPALAREAARRLELRTTPTLAYSAATSAPIIWCWGRRPHILVPCDIESMSDEALLGVMCHELAHWRRRDHLAELTGEIVAALLAWHPLAWIGRSELRARSESACDAWAIEHGAPAMTYADTLLRLVPRRAMALALAASRSRRSVARRLHGILDDQPHRLGLAPARALVTALVLLASIGAASLAHRQAPIPAAKTSTGPVMHAVPIAPEASVGVLVQIAPEEIDLGTFAPGAKGEGSFWIVNRGAIAAHVTEAKPDCGCTTVVIEPRWLHPGESMEIDFTIKAPSKPGERRTRNITVLVDDHPAIKTTVHIAAEQNAHPEETG